MQSWLQGQTDDGELAEAVFEGLGHAADRARMWASAAKSLVKGVVAVSAVKEDMKRGQVRVDPSGPERGSWKTRT